MEIRIEDSSLIKQEKADKNQVVVKSNSHDGDIFIMQPYYITMSSHDLNIHELRIMTRIIQALQPQMEYNKDRYDVQKTLFEDYILRLPTKDLLPENSNNYWAVKAALTSMEKKMINVIGKDKNGDYQTNARLIMKSKYYLNNQMVEIQLDRDLLPEILALAKNYSRYLVDVVFNSSSTYTARLYMFLSHWKDKKKMNVSISSLRAWLGLGNKYELSNDFKKFILEPAAIDLKNRADVWFEIDTPIKEGRAVTGFGLKIYKRSNNKALNMAHSQNIKYSLMELFGLSAYHLKQLEDIISKPELHAHIHDKINDIYGYVRSGNIKNPKAYVVTSLKNEFSEHALKE